MNSCPAFVYVGLGPVAARARVSVHEVLDPFSQVGPSALFVLKAQFSVSFLRELSSIFRPYFIKIHGVVYGNGRFIQPFFSAFFLPFSVKFRPFFVFFCFLRHRRPSLALLASFLSTLCVVICEGKLTRECGWKGSALVASEQDLEQLKDALGSRRNWHHGEGDTGRFVPGPDFRDMAFLPTQNLFSEDAHIAVIKGKAISSSDVSGQSSQVKLILSP